MCKLQQFDDSESEGTAPKKRQRFNERNNEKGQGLNENESEVKGDRYVPLSSFALPPLPRKRLNRLSDIDEETRSLTYLVRISKNC